MREFLLRYVAPIFSVLLFATCSNSDEVDSTDQGDIDRQTFEVAANTIGLYNIGMAIEKIDYDEEQVIQSSEGKLLRVVSDEGCLVFSFELSDVASSVGRDLVLTYTSANNSSPQSYNVAVVKIDQGYVWLWDAESQVGFVMLEW